jgi:hypothetical protein
MRGIVDEIKENPYGSRYGFIKGEDGKTYYFGKATMRNASDINNFKEKMSIEFTPCPPMFEGAKPVASNLVSLASPVRFYRAGFSKSFDIDRMDQDHLKWYTGEKEILIKLSRVLYIAYGNHHDLGHNNLFPQGFRSV